MPTSGKIVWVGRVISIVAALLFVFSAAMKFMGGPQLDQGMAHLGLPARMVIPLAVLEAACVILYLVPPTAVLGAILLTGYVGGTIVTHWRVGDLFVVNIILGILVWLGLYLREDRLKELIPILKRR
jgi:hypothetical protein